MRGKSKRSYTAESVAGLRAAGTYDRDSNSRNPDYLAESFIDWWMRIRVRITLLRIGTLAVLDRLMPGIYLFITARTKYLDSALLAEVRSGAQQLVILGADADSRAYRFADELTDVRVFELDHPATSAWKKRQIQKLFGALPEKVTYVSIDFTSEDLDSVLDSSGIQREVRTVFLWEGVAPYLTVDAVDAVLHTVARFSPGSSIIFDYFYTSAFAGSSPYPEARKYVRRLAGYGEPLMSGLDPDKLDAYLAKCGLELVDHAGPDELRKRCLAGNPRRATRFWALVLARVPGR